MRRPPLKLPGHWEVTGRSLGDQRVGVPLVGAVLLVLLWSLYRSVNSTTPPPTPPHSPFIQPVQCFWPRPSSFILLISRLFLFHNIYNIQKWPHECASAPFAGSLKDRVGDVECDLRVWASRATRGQAFCRMLAGESLVLWLQPLFGWTPWCPSALEQARLSQSEGTRRRHLSAAVGRMWPLGIMLFLTTRQARLVLFIWMWTRFTMMLR